MKQSKITVLGLVAAASLVMLLLLVSPTVAGEHDRNPLEKIAALLEGADLELADAVARAESHTGGRAFAASIDVEDGITAYEVLLHVPGESPKIVEAVVHAKTGKILEVDVEYPKGDDEHDDDDDDDEHEDDDDDDEDDEHEDDDD